MIDAAIPGPDDSDVAGVPGQRQETTGRYVVVFAESADPAQVLASAAGMKNVASSSDFADEAVDVGVVDGSDGIVFAQLGVAVVSADPSQVGALRAAGREQSHVMSVSRELIHHVLPATSGYAQGYRDGVADLTTRLGAPGLSDSSVGAAQSGTNFTDNAQFTWGLQAAGVNASSQSGKGIKVAVLDTGFDSTHPDFTGRTITTNSFVPGQTAQDGHGHGTHCIGTSCGPKSPSTGPRYGIAYEADIFVGKVLNNSGSGTDGGIIAGIDWAITNGCHVISMSLGADVAQVHPPYTAVGSRALDAGSLIVAAAGNNADRRVGKFGFVGPPANSPFIMAVAAVDGALDVAFFSSRSLPGRGGQVDIAGPGLAVYSSWPMPTRYRTISGTSMATPHVAGTAALWAQQTGYRGRELWSSLAQESQRLLAPSADVGGGLVLAPQ